MQIIPAILTNDVNEFNSLIASISPKYDRVQIDFIDGEYTNNKTLMPSNVDSDIKMDAHLMVTEKNLSEYLKYANKFNRVIVQMESIASPENYECLALDIHSPVEAIKPYLQNLKYLNLMAIEPGFGGQEFDEKIFSKINQLIKWRNDQMLKFEIAVDGGVEKEHLQKLQDLGVDEAIVGAKRLLSW